MAIKKTTNVATEKLSEHHEQVRLVAWFDQNYPAHAGRLIAIPNGGARNIVVATKLKTEGVRAGVPDLFLPIPVGGKHGLWVELKKSQGGRVSDKQKDWLDYLLAMGYDAQVCHGADAAAKTIKNYLERK